MTDTLFMQKSTVQCLSIYPLNEEGIGRIENQMNRYGEGNTRNPRKGGGYNIKGAQKNGGRSCFCWFYAKLLDDELL